MWWYRSGNEQGDEGMAQDLDFGFVVAPVGAEGLDDAALYQEVIADCRYGQSLG